MCFVLGMDSNERGVPGAPEAHISVPANIFSLPVDIRNSIYKRVLVVSPVLLFQDSYSQKVETFAPDIPFRWLALLHTSRQVHDEARTVLYGMNHFTLVETTQHQGSLLPSFLNCIGPVNSALLSHLSMNFPIAESVQGQPGKAMLNENDLHSLKVLQEQCTSLTTLETLIHSGKSHGLSQDDSQFNREALLEINAQLKDITSLERIIVRSYGGTPIPSVMELMQSFGWVILGGP